jgi:RNA polymerase sigma-70 factor (ECF subfamily)
MWIGELTLPAWFGGRSFGGDEAEPRRARPRSKILPPPAERSDDADNPVLVRLRQGDVQALDLLLTNYSAGLIRYAATIVGSIDAAEDVVQDVFIKVWNVRSTLKPTGDFGAYLLRMTRNRALDVMRHERAEARRHQTADALERVGYNEGAVAVETDELARRLFHAIDSLPQRSRDVFLMRKRSGLSSVAVAQALGITVAAVHVHLSRALRRIAIVLQNDTEKK